MLDEEKKKLNGNSKLFRVMNRSMTIENPWWHDLKYALKKMYSLKYTHQKSPKNQTTVKQIQKFTNFHKSGK